MPRLRRFRFSLRQGAILVTLACIACAGVNQYWDYREQRRVAQHVREVLEKPDSPSQILYTYSTVGRRASLLVSYDDDARLVAELFRLLNDPDWQSRNRMEAVRALRMMSDRPGVAEDLVQLSQRKPYQGRLIRELAHVKREHRLVVKRLLELTHHYDDSTRRAAYSALADIASRHPEFSDQVAAALIGALRDPYEETRVLAASKLGGLRHPELARALTAALDDPSDRVRVGAARSLWKITGDDDPLVRIASEVLLSDDAESRCDLQAIHSLTGIDVLPPETIGALRECVAAAASAPNADWNSMKRQLGRAARKLLRAKGFDENVSVAAKGE